MVEINGRKVYRSVPGSLRPDLYALAQNSLLDEDAIVRQNLLKYYQYLRVSMPVLTLEKLLRDSDQGVLLSALNRLRVMPVIAALSIESKNSQFIRAEGLG